MDSRHVGLIIGDDDRLVAVIPVRESNRSDSPLPDNETSSPNEPPALPHKSERFYCLLF
jgi:hypothetical protein